MQLPFRPMDWVLTPDRTSFSVSEIEFLLWEKIGEIFVEDMDTAL